MRYIFTNLEVVTTDSRYGYSEKMYSIFSYHNCRLKIPCGLVVFHWSRSRDRFVLHYIIGESF